MSKGTYREGFITGQDSVLEQLQGINPEAVPNLLEIAKKALHTSARVHPDFAKEIRVAIAKAEE